MITLPICAKSFSGEIRKSELHDDFRWISPWSAYRHPAGKTLFDPRRTERGHGAAGVFAACEDVREVEDYEWPNPDYLDFTESLTQLREAGDVYRAGGFWSPFFHVVADFFGMENYFVKMYTHPDVVHAVTGHVVEFFVEANRRCFETSQGLVDGFFFGNDFGTQQDLLISPDAFKEFVFPYFRRLTRLGKQHGLQVILHSCGAIGKVIPDLLALGVDALHPLQARAAGMSAEELAARFKGRVTFIGGVDTQELLVHATPREVKADVRRLKRLLGPNLVVSPSHEALLPNVPPANLEAMAEAALE